MTAANTAPNGGEADSPRTRPRIRDATTHTSLTFPDSVGRRPRRDVLGYSHNAHRSWPQVPRYGLYSVIELGCPSLRPNEAPLHAVLVRSRFN